MAARRRAFAVWLLVVACGPAATLGGANQRPQCDGAPTYAPPPRGQPAEPVKLKDSRFVGTGSGGSGPVQMKAVSWFGVADNGTALVESLWSGGSAAATDMPAVAYRLRAAGFNAIRLPFTFSDLRAPANRMWAKQGCRKVTLGSGDASSAAAAGAGASAGGGPAAAATAAAAPARCSWYLPDSSSLDRYLWSVQWFASNGFYVLAEFRPSPDDATSRNEASFADAWRWLWRAVACLPNFEADLKGRVFVDLLASPDAAGHRWEAVEQADGTVPGIASLYLQAMDALWADTPDALVFFIAGAGQGGVATWGSGFTTDKAIVAVNDFSDPNPFFKALLSRPYRGAVVLVPSVYNTAAPPPSADLLAPAPPPAWPAGPGPVKVMDTTFAYLAKEGYCVDSDCQRFPIAIGEFASTLSSSRPQLEDLNAFAAHLSSAGVDFGGVGTWRFWGFDAPAAPPAAT